MFGRNMLPTHTYSGYLRRGEFSSENCKWQRRTEGNAAAAAVCDIP